MQRIAKSVRYGGIIYLLLLLLGTVNTAIAQEQIYKGAIIRGDTSKKEMALIFTGHEFADGGKFILKTLRKSKVKASFFFTGDFNRKYPRWVKKLVKEGHYLGSHSDQHPLYCAWENRDSLLVSKKEFVADLEASYIQLQRFGVSRPFYFLPPYEWYNEKIAEWTAEQGLQLINFTGGTRSNADYTTPAMTNYQSSGAILQSIIKFEEEKNLNGFMLLMHVGTDAARTDKFCFLLPTLLKFLKESGYKPVRVDTLLNK